MNNNDNIGEEEEESWKKRMIRDSRFIQYSSESITIQEP